MPHILLLYGTTDGHTRKIALDLGATLTAAGCAVDIVAAADERAAVNPAAYDGVIVAASVHYGGYQRPVRRWVQRHAAALRRLPTAFVSVCLGILEQREQAQRETRETVDRFLLRVGWRPTATKLVAGAVPFSRYGPIKRWVMKRIMARAGGATDPTRDYEYTDWPDLRAFALAFAREYGLLPTLPSSRTATAATR